MPVIWPAESWPVRCQALGPPAGSVEANSLPYSEAMQRVVDAHSTALGTRNPPNWNCQLELSVGLVDLRICSSLAMHSWDEGHEAAVIPGGLGAGTVCSCQAPSP